MALKWFFFLFAQGFYFNYDFHVLFLENFLSVNLKMEHQKQAISEDLYNLTQLAEVSLAVGPINTTFKTEPHNQHQDSKNLSSSDEDSVGYYSHKLFDRRKVRRSFTSTSYSSGNGSQSSSGEENCYEPKMRRNCEDEHVCPECGKKYSTSSNLARHRQTHR